jgi:hypothetical protein
VATLNDFFNELRQINGNLLQLHNDTLAGTKELQQINDNLQRLLTRLPAQDVSPRGGLSGDAPPTATPKPQAPMKT